jgi:hypothetical protein
MIMKNFFIILGLVPLTATASFAQYYQQPQYNPPSFFSPGGGAAPVVVPPTVITTSPPVIPESSKKSCRENVIDLFLISWRTTTGDCNP